MPPTLGGTRLRRPVTALVSASAILALTFVGALPTAPVVYADDATGPSAAATPSTPADTTATPASDQAAPASASPTPAPEASTPAAAPAAQPAADAARPTTNSVAPTAGVRTTEVAAKANAYTDRKHTKTSHKNVGSPKANRTRYAAYYAFPGVGLAAGESVKAVALTLKSSASHSGSGALEIRAVNTGWSGSRVTFRSRPNVSTVIGKTSAKKGTLSIALNASETARYLTSGISIRITRAGSNHVVKLNRKPSLRVVVRTPTPTPKPPATSNPAPAPAPVTTPPPAPTNGAITGKPVFAHYFPPYPISIDNYVSTKDYYTVNYLQASGESGKFANIGGLLRDRPLPRDPITSSDYESVDMATEISNAMNGGVTGFAVDLLTVNTSDKLWRLTVKLIKAAENQGSFKIMLQPDMSSLGSISTSTFAASMASLATSKAVYTDRSGAVVICPFYAELKSPAWYSEAFSILQSQYGIRAALMPLFLDAGQMSNYASISVGFANWGARSVPAANDINWAARAHSIGKSWMEPVAVQDERPVGQIYDEAWNTETLRATWNRAINQGADAVLLTTWNDYSEGTSFQPSTDHGTVFLDIGKYYVNKFRTGAFPNVTKDAVYITHRIQKYSTMPTTYTNVMKLRSGSATPRDKVEVLTVLTAPATVTVTIGGRTSSYDAPAGLSAQLFDLAEGYSTATVTRGGAQTATVTTTDAVKFTTEQQDLSYHAVGSK